MDTIFNPSFPRMHAALPAAPLEFKLALVEPSLEPGASLERIAREHGVNAN